MYDAAFADRAAGFPVDINPIQVQKKIAGKFEQSGAYLQ